METKPSSMGFRPIVSLCVAALLLGACTPLPRAAISLQVQASKHLNTETANTAALPVRLKIYQLNDVTRFYEATFRQLWKSDVLALDTTLLNKKELTINPGETQSIKMARHDQAEYMAVVGIFRHHEGHGWKRVRPIPGQINSMFKKMVIVAKNNSVEIR